MADGGDKGGGGFGKLIVGGAVAWLAWQLLQQQGLTGGACPPDAVQVRLPDGSMRCVPASQVQGLGAGGMNVGQVITIIGGVVGIVTQIGTGVVGILKAAGVIGAAVPSGAGAAGTAATTVGTSVVSTTTTATTTATTTTTTAAAEEGGDLAAQLISVGIDTSFATGLGLMALLYIAAELTVNIAQWIGDVSRNRNRADRTAPTNFDDILYNEQAAFVGFTGNLVARLNATIQDASSKAGVAPVYPNLNQQQNVPLNGFGRFGRFGAVVARPPSTTIRQPTVAAIAVSAPMQQLLSALAAGTGPNTSTPYSTTYEGYTGGRNELGSTIAYCAGAGSPCYYLTGLDPRLPVGMLRDYRGLMRWMFWTTERAYNSTMSKYWQSRIAAEGGISECPGVDAATCLAKFVVPENQFDALVSAYYAGIPSSELLPASYQTFQTYPELNALAYEYIQNLNIVAAKAGAPQIDFDKLTRSLVFNGTAQAMTQAAWIGFGTFWSTWPGDYQFSEMIRIACGLDALGWMPPSETRVVNPAYGGAAYRWLVLDQTTNWFVDVVGSRDARQPMCYRFQPAGEMPGAPDAYIPLNGYGERRARRPRFEMGYAVPLDPVRRRGLRGLLARGFSL